MKFTPFTPCASIQTKVRPAIIAERDNIKKHYTMKLSQKRRTLESDIEAKAQEIHADAYPLPTSAICRSI